MYPRNEAELEQVVDFVAEHLRLGDVDLYLRGDTHKAGKHGASAYVKVNPAYRHAHLTFSQDFDTLEDFFRVVVHELIHVKMMPLQGFWDALRPTLGKPLKKVAAEHYRQADEGVTVGLERVLHPLLWDLYCEAYDDEGTVDDAGSLPEPQGISLAH